MDISSASPTCVPPGFRFHPTEEELVGYYLKKKIHNTDILYQNLNVIIDIDLCTMEPWDIQGKCIQGAYDEQKEWYFFSHKGKKYPTGSRTNRATAAGFWKATGRDKAVLSKNQVIGMRKTLVFYQGRAPNGKRTDWIIHEYRLQAYLYGPPQEEGWVVCRAFKKASPNQPSYTRFLYNHIDSHDQLPSSMATSSSSPSIIMPQQELVYDPGYIYSGHYPVEVPEIDVSDYDHLLAKQGLITELWDSSLNGSFN